MKRDESESAQEMHFVNLLNFLGRTCEAFKAEGIETTVPINRWIMDMYKKGARDPHEVLAVYTGDSKLREQLASTDYASITKIIVRDNGRCATKDITDVDRMDEIIDVDDADMHDADMHDADMDDERKRVMEEDAIDVDNEDSVALTDFDIMRIQRLVAMRYMQEKNKTYVSPDDIYKMTPEDDMEYSSRNIMASTNPAYNQKLDLHNLMPVMKYFKSAKDIVNFMKLSKPYSRMIAMLKYNPVGDVSMDFFPNLQTQVFYSPEQYVKNRSKTAYRDVIWYPEYSANMTRYDADKTIFKNIRYHCTDSEKRLAVFDVPRNIHSLDKHCFSNADTEHVMLNNVRTLSSWCFACSELVDIAIPDGVSVIPNNCFETCTRLTRVTLPNSLVEIQYQAFKNCRYLKDCRLPDSVAIIGKECFTGCLYCNINIPLSLTDIEPYAFSSTGIEEAMLHDGTEEIEHHCFSCCSELKIVTIPQSVARLDGRAFMVCHKLVFVACPARFVERFMVMDSCHPLAIMDTTSERMYYRASYLEPHYVPEEELEDNGALIIDIRNLYKSLPDECKAVVVDFLPTYITADI